MIQVNRSGGALNRLMKRLADRLLSRRAYALAKRIQEHMPAVGIVADVGSGTGHNAEAVRSVSGLEVQEFDVADLHWVGTGPILFKDSHLPVAAGSFDATLLWFVLQYPDSPLDLLNELRRVTRGKVLVLQSTHCNAVGKRVLAIREFVKGRLAFHLAVFAGFIYATECPLRPRRFFAPNDLRQLFAKAGFSVIYAKRFQWIGFTVSRDLYVLEAAE